MVTFERIKFLANQMGKSLNQVEEDLNYGKNVLYRLKNSSPSAERLQELASYFNVSTDYLLGRTDNPNLPESEDVNNKSLAKQVMMRMNTEGLSEEDILGVEKEIEKFFTWRIEEIRRENENKQ